MVGSNFYRTSECWTVLIAALAGFLLLLVTSISWSLIPDLRAEVGLFLGSYPLALLGWWLSMWAAQRAERSKKQGVSWRSIGLVALGSLMLCLPLLGQAPSLSDDAYRYIWEGRLILFGYNPYDLAPNAPVLLPLRDGYHSNINHPDWTAIYPPGALLLMAGTQAIAPGLLSWKLAVLGGHMLVLLILGAKSRQSGSFLPVVAWGWCPLVIVEVAHSAHLDVIAIAAFLCGVIALRERPGLGWASLTLGGIVKYLPLVMLPWVFRKRPWKTTFAATVLTLLAVFLPFAGAGVGLARSLIGFARLFEGTPVAFPLLEAVFGGTGGRVVLVIAALGVVVALRSSVIDGTRSAWSAAGIVVAIVVIGSPLVHPWYLLWLLPFAATSGRSSVLWLCSAAPLTYGVLLSYQDTGTWELPPVLWVSWVLPAILLEITQPLVRRPQPFTAPEGRPHADRRLSPDPQPSKAG